VPDAFSYFSAPIAFSSSGYKLLLNMVGLLYRLRTFLESSAFIRGRQNHC